MRVGSTTPDKVVDSDQVVENNEERDDLGTPAPIVAVNFAKLLFFVRILLCE